MLEILSSSQILLVQSFSNWGSLIMNFYTSALMGTAEFYHW